MPVGTQGTVKAVSPHDLEEAGVALILANTYHLYLRPGHRIIEKLGGLHGFTGWTGPILTDSGGFQVYSLANLRTISEDGVTFRSHLDGSKHFLGPSEVMEIQGALGSDIMMTLDDCPPYPSEHDDVADSVRLTTIWADRCRELKRDRSQALFGIVQGGTYLDLRERSAADLTAMDFDGYAVGGLSVGEERSLRFQVIGHTVGLLPQHKPVYLMGVGTPEDLVDAVLLGVDMFDCVLPTRNARNGTLFTARGRINIKNRQYAADERPVEEKCRCYTCDHYSRGYLRHLNTAGELLAYRLNTIHNLSYFMRLMAQLRDAISEDRVHEFRREFYKMRGLTERGT